ncbi:MAG: helix-turn-helix transcriptional regulator [Verrucomicrobia bacterium]|nr:helix-turn-helix transcriptional regulator [Verrucomicrobiota bacterium]
MPRPVSIQDDVILRAAREIFLAKGLEATTSEIAAKAGVSHGIIFKRFKTKQALFQSAMQEQSDWGQTIAELLNSGVGRDEVQTTLYEVGFVFVQKFLILIPTLMMSWSNKPDDVSDVEQTATVGKARAAQAQKAVKTIAAYLEAENRLGRIRDMDFEVVAQAFVGALWHHSFLQVMLGGGKTGPAKERRYVKQLVQSLWLGLEPESIPRRRRKS